MPDSDATVRNEGQQESDFPFREGDRVLVRVRERGTSGKIVAKFEAECVKIRTGQVGMSDRARFDLPWGNSIETTTLRPYEAEFEVIDDE